MAMLSPGISVTEKDVNIIPPAPALSMMQVSGTDNIAWGVNDIGSTSIANVDSIDHRAIQGDITKRFNNYKKQLLKWTDPYQYRTMIQENGNNIKYVVNPTKEDYFLAIKHGARPEFIDMNVITLKELEIYVNYNPAEFI